MVQLKWTRASHGRNYLTRRYEPLQPYLLSRLARHCECDTFLDVGANIGLYSMLFAASNEDMSVHAYEPSPTTFEELKHNIALNGLVRIQANRVAVSDRPGKVDFGVVHELSGANSVVDTSIHRSDTFTKHLKVDAVRLDDQLDFTGRRICVKIDVEGHELCVLNGMRRLLHSNQVIIQVEFYPAEDDPLRSSLADAGLVELFAIRTDRYFASREMAPSHEQVVRIFEEATADLIGENLEQMKEDFTEWGGVWPLSVRVPGYLNLQLLGPGATFLRSIKHRLRRGRRAGLVT